MEVSENVLNIILIILHKTIALDSKSSQNDVHTLKPLGFSLGKSKSCDHVTLLPVGLSRDHLRGHPYMTSALRGGGRVRKLADFADEQY